MFLEVNVKFYLYFMEDLSDMCKVNIEKIF